MKSLQVYLTFNGNCEEALNFYKTCIGGEILSLQRFSEAPMPCDDAHKSLVMHAEFKSEEVYLMASDSMPETQVSGGNNTTLNLNFTDEQEQATVFEKLTAGGVIMMPLQDTFWGARFGMFTDKFGISWMTNCEKK
jgi:PhnB protein